LKSLEYFFLNAGLSWTSSRLIPYFLFLLLGFLIAYLLRNKKLAIKWLNLLKNSFLILIPIGIYFALFPIYEGDVIDLGVKVKTDLPFNQTKTLSIVVLPDCPFCLETIAIAKVLMERNPKCTINYIIASKPNEIPHGIADKIPQKCSYRLESNILQLSQITHGAYPTYCLSEKGKLLRVWRSEHFGTKALDEIEYFFRN
jgi:hypothetical protein